MDCCDLSGSGGAAAGSLLLLRNVRNAKRGRQSLLQGQLGSGLALLKAQLIPDPRIVQVAWVKAKLAETREKMTTRQLGTEVVFNMR